MLHSGRLLFSSSCIGLFIVFQWISVAGMEENLRESSNLDIRKAVNPSDLAPTTSTQQSQVFGPVTISQRDAFRIAARISGLADSCSLESPPSISEDANFFGTCSTPVTYQLLSSARNATSPLTCFNGNCTSGCECACGWSGQVCQWCAGRLGFTATTIPQIITSGPFNYSDASRCTWLITTPTINSTKYLPGQLQIRIKSFSTECSWDMLFVYDGPAANPASQLAVLTGDLTPAKLATMKPLISKSGRLLLSFFADDYINFSGFVLEYSYSPCPMQCSSHGNCILSTGNSTCHCDAGYTGQICDQPIQSCPNSCSSSGKCIGTTCFCDVGFEGADCSVQVNGTNYWENVPFITDMVLDSSHASAVAGSAVLVLASQVKTAWSTDGVFFIGGYDFSTVSSNLTIRRFDLSSNMMETIFATGEQVSNRYGHSAVLRQSSIYIYGGTLTGTNLATADLLQLDLATMMLSVVSDGQVPVEVWETGPAALTGHTAHYIPSIDSMLVFFGYNSNYGISDLIRVYNFGTNLWNVLESRVLGRVWHASVYHPDSSTVYISGGYAKNNSRTDMTSLLLRYDVTNNIWRAYSSALLASFPRAFHSMVLLESSSSSSVHAMIYGGSASSWSPQLSKAGVWDDMGQCFVSGPVVFDVSDPICTFAVNDVKNSQIEGSGRLGHTAVFYNGTAFFFSGFDGTVVDTILRFVALPCDQRSNPKECQVLNGFTCIWVCDACWGADKLTPPSWSQANVTNCTINSEPEPICTKGFPFQTPITSIIVPSDRTICDAKSTCLACLSLSNTSPFQSADVFSPCEWFGVGTTETCSTAVVNLTMVNQVGLAAQSIALATAGQKQGMTLLSLPGQCNPTCGSYSDCDNCTTNTGCLWCLSAGLCISADAYRIAFPFGQCLDWTANTSRCSIAMGCGSYMTCSDCQRDQRCGWCDDGSGSGSGTCTEGSADAPTSGTCAHTNWNFIGCPLCQCNGHSHCHPSTSQCIACSNNTVGEFCDTCASGFYGSAPNGGLCSRKS